MSPPVNAVELYTMISEISGNDDPFFTLKKESNQLALNLVQQAKEKIDLSPDPFRAALKFAIAGNVIDYGAHHELDVHLFLEEFLAKDPVIDDYKLLKQELTQAHTILYLVDNCGEIVFDCLVCEKLAEKKIIVAVKERPIINDATIADAFTSGIDRFSKVISNGTGCPGTPLENCSAQFQEAFHNADLIISKGQGNFETLSETKAPVFFLLTVKCQVVCGHIAEKTGAPAKKFKIGDTILMRAR